MSDWQVEMADIVSDIARNLIAKHGSNNRGILLLSSFALDSISHNVFVGKEGYIEYSNVIADDRENLDLLWDLKFTPPVGKRFEGIELFVKSRTLTTKILYPDDIDQERDDLEVRREVVYSYFGEGKIVYPPMPEGFWDQDAG